MTETEDELLAEEPAEPEPKNDPVVEPDETPEEDHQP